MLKQYQIDLKKFSPSTTYKFNYLLDNEFFERVDGPEVRKGKVHVTLSVIRVSSTYEMSFQLEGVISVMCDRCLEDLEISVETTNRLFVTFGETYAETSDDRIIISKEEGSINIAWHLYEFVALAIPIKHVHEPGECSEVMLSMLKVLCVDDLTEKDAAVVQTERRQINDPRWDALRHLKEDI